MADPVKPATLAHLEKRTTGYEIKHGLTCGYVEECPLEQAVMESSVERILLLDSSKFGKVSTCSFAPIKDFNVVITDQRISAEYAQDIRAQGPEALDSRNGQYRRQS